MKNIKPFLLLLLLALSPLGCSTSSSDDTSDTELTLSSCTTTIDDSVSDFFQTYFKCVTISLEGTSVVIEANGLPPHKSYYYGEEDPNFEEFDTSRGEEYSPNPNLIAEQSIHIEIPVEPTSKGLTITEELVDGTVGTSDEEYPMSFAGVALDSVPLFNPLAAPGDDIADEQFTFDSYNSHPTDSGQYHYHTSSPGPLEVLESIGLITITTLRSAEIELFGIMCDGTIVLGCTELDGSTPDDSNFDAQNGHQHDLVDTDNTTLFENRYHTHICTDLFTNHLYTPEIQFYTTCVAE